MILGERLNFLECAEGDYGVLEPMSTDAKIEKYVTALPA
jgi:hypothetical protein